MHAHRIMGSPGGEYCKSLQRSVWRGVVSPLKKSSVFRHRMPAFAVILSSLTNSRGSRVAGPKSRVAGPKSRSRVQSRGRGSNVAVAGSMSRSRVQSRGRGSNVAAEENDLVFKVTE